MIEKCMVVYVSFVGLVAVKEHGSKVDVVHRCFIERSDSILGAFCQPLRKKLQDEQ